MAGNTLTTASVMMCPHGGSVSAISTSPRATASATVLRSADTYLIAGCPFVLPNGVASPCVTIQWSSPDTSVKVGGAPTLSQGSVGLCMSALQAPQGTAQILSTQPRVSTR